MFRLTREVRFTVADAPVALVDAVINGHAGHPPVTGLDRFLILQVTLEGPLQSHSQYLRNIKDIDAVVREIAIPAIVTQIGNRQLAIGNLFTLLGDQWPGATLSELKLAPSPFFSLSVNSREFPMIRLSQKFEFSASHRLHNPSLDEATNRRTFGKCNNPHGHGHNYELQVTLSGAPGANGLLMDVPSLQRIVEQSVIERFDHRNLNVELSEFKTLIPTVENIAAVIFRILREPIRDAGATLASVTVWETPRTWCEYSE